MLLKIEGVITKDTVTQVRAALASLEPIDLYINSPGGDLFAGLTIFEALNAYDEDLNIYVENVAGSIASVIALAGTKKPSISENGSFVIHNAHVEETAGNHNDLRKVANSLEKYSEIVANIYAKKTGRSPEDIAQAMNEETVFSSADAIAFGLAGDLYNPIKALAQINKIDMTILERIKNNLSGEPTPEIVNVEGEEEAPTEATLTEEMKAEITELVKTLIAEALAGETEALAEGLSEEIGNSIATIFNEIKSEGVPPSGAPITEPTPGGKAVTGIEAFNQKMNEIKNR
jgi:ATP-dependent protease ClpP protease subunit